MNEIDYLMNLQAEELSEAETMSLIDYYRKLRISYDQGVKPAKKGEGTVKLDMIKMGLVKSKPAIRRI